MKNLKMKKGNSAAFHLSTQTVKLYLHNPLPIIFSILKYESGIRDDEERSSSGVDGSTSSHEPECSLAVVFFNHDMLLLIFGAKLKGDCEKMRSSPPQRSCQWTPRPSFCYVELEVGFVLKVKNLCAIIGIELQSCVLCASIGSDLNGGVAGVIEELHHGDAGTRKMDAWGTLQGQSKRPSCSEAGNHFFPSLYEMATSKPINHQSHP
ncbi:hypothetical protein ACFX2I_034199 [Malus domestica]